MVNRVILIGNLGSDPETRSFENGSKVARFSVATNESYKDREGQWQDRTEWHDVVAWRMLADRAEQSLRKGVQVYVEGKLTHRSWEDTNGNKRRTTEVEASYFRIINRRDGQGGNSRPPFPSATDEPTSQPPSMAPQDKPDFPTTENDKDDLPF